MNIVIIGGGQKFGKFAADKFRSFGHNVFVLSHKLYEEADNQHLWADFSDTVNILRTFDQLTKDINQIDIFIYASRAFPPHNEEPAHFFASNSFSLEKNWIESMRVNVSIPHDLIRCALLKMDSSSKIVFLTTALSFLPLKRLDIKNSYMAEYVGTKSAQNHLMFGFANNNDREATVFSISTHLDDEQTYLNNADRIVNAIINSDTSNNGKILEFY